MANKQNPEEAKLPPIKPALFILFRHIYKEYLTGKSISTLSESFRCDVRKIKEAIKYMTKHLGTDFGDKLEIEIAKGRAEKRCDDIRAIYEIAMGMGKHSIALKCIKELRNEEALIYNLKGLLGIKLPELGGALKGGITLIMPIQMGINKIPNHMKDVTPDTKKFEVPKEEITIEN